MLLAGGLGAEATTGAGTLGLRAAAKDLSPVETVGCRTVGPVCRLDGRGYAGPGAAGAPAAGARSTAAEKRDHWEAAPDFFAFFAGLPTREKNILRTENKTCTFAYLLGPSAPTPSRRKG